MPGNTSKRYPAELKARAVRMYHECRPDQATDWAAMGHVANLLGIATAETLRKWVRQDQVDQWSRPGVRSEESPVSPRSAELPASHQRRSKARQPQSLFGDRSAFGDHRARRPRAGL